MGHSEGEKSRRNTYCFRLFCCWGRVDYVTLRLLLVFSNSEAQPAYLSPWVSTGAGETVTLEDIRASALFREIKTKSQIILTIF